MGHSGPFGCLTKVGAKQADLVQKFVPRSHVGIFWNERTQSTPLDPILTFWCVPYYSDAFGTVWLPYKTRCNKGRICAKIRATKSRRNFSHAPEIPHRNLNSRFGAFHTIWVHSGPFGCLTKLGQNGRTCAKVRATKSRWNFLQRMHPNHPIRT